MPAEARSGIPAGQVVKSLENPEKGTMPLFLGAQAFNKEQKERCSRCAQPFNEELGLKVDLLSLNTTSQ